jgi:hypothetical protein
VEAHQFPDLEMLPSGNKRRMNLAIFTANSFEAGAKAPLKGG